MHTYVRAEVESVYASKPLRDLASCQCLFVSSLSFFLHTIQYDIHGCNHMHVHVCAVGT